MIRTLSIWIFDQIAAAIIGGFIGSVYNSVFNPYAGGLGLPIAVLAVMGAFACLRLWLAPKSKVAFGLKGKAKMWRESWVAGASNTGNVTATVGNKLVLNWHGTATQRDGVLKIFPVIRDKMMPGGELGSCADAIIASIHDGGMSADDHGSNVQSIAMLWRVFTTRLENGTYGDLITRTNMHATFELHEQINDQFKVTWKISVMRGRTP
ncbi:MAG: hypothetical protein WB495_28045 [Xanthobacteraceae bacterium]